MNCWTALSLAAVILTASRCDREKDTLRIEPVRYEDGTIVTGDVQADSLFVQDRFLTDTTFTDKGDTLFIIRHTSAYLRLELTGLQANTPIERIDLIPTYGEFKGMGSLFRAFPGTRTPDDGPLVVWAAFASQDFSGSSFAVVVHGTGGTRWTALLPGISFESGTAYSRTVSCLDATAPDPGLTATPLPQTLTGTDSGEYSGITWLSGDSYAAVSDNLKGGGVVLFTIPIESDGSVGEVKARIPEGTAQAGGKSRDPEGIACIPGRNRLYISSEKHQDIREYDLEGHETGAGLRIPGDFSASAITANKGFEALTFNEETGLFWTTTEAPLKRDTFLPRLHRLQSFGRDGAPGKRYFYETDTPAKSPAEAAHAQAYVFGIPAMTALDDGRLIVLEREVYVPKGGLLDKFLDSFTRTSLYLVDPARDEAGILRKSLLCTFSTNSVDLANYEGMCLGPTLPDGRRCLLLISDSQNGGGGLTQEYVKVVLLR